jgi:hypothetical protein
MKLSKICVVISQAAHPTLFTRLGLESNDRARAALLKRLAEAGARQEFIASPAPPPSPALPQCATSAALPTSCGESDDFTSDEGMAHFFE